MEITIGIIFLLLIGFGFYIFNKKNNQKLDKEIALQREKFNALKNQMSEMTADEIAIATGASRRSVIARLSSRKIKCKDFDGRVSVEDRQKLIKEQELIGVLRPEVICTQCNVKGQVYEKNNADKISTTSDTTNLTAAILSGTKRTVEKVTQMHCKNCQVTWTI